MAKGRDHEFVRALEINPKAVPWRIEIGFCVVMGLQVLCKDKYDQALNWMLFHYHHIHVGCSTQ